MRRVLAPGSATCGRSSGISGELRHRTGAVQPAVADGRTTRSLRSLARPPLNGYIVGPTVHPSLLGGVLLLAACAAGPVPIAAGEVVGHYCFTVGPDEREEFSFQADGRLAWERFSNAWLRERGAGHWSACGNEVTVVLPGRSHALHGAAGTLALRRFGGHVYLVRDADLEWFERHGPMDEFCFSRDGAPLVDPPAYKAAQHDAAADDRPHAGDRA